MQGNRTLPIAIRMMIFITGAALIGFIVEPFHPPDAVEAAPRQASSYSIFLSSVLRDWVTPCGVIPILVSPPDGSRVPASSKLVFDGRYQPRGSWNWLVLEVRQNADFTGEGITLYNQPASGVWEQVIEDLEIPPGRYYWRTSVTCNGPGWPPSPGAHYDQSPFSEVWTFSFQ